MSASKTQNGKVSKRFICKMLIPLVSLCLLTSSAIAAENPKAVVQDGTEQVFKIIRQYPQASRARIEQIQEVIDRYFDFERMARFTIGPEWKRISAQEQQAFTNQFKTLLLVTYIGDIAKFAGQSITYYTRSLSPDYAMVEIAVYNEGNPIYLDYSLHMKDGSWKVFDVSVGGISLVLRYRDQFDSFLTNRPFGALLTALRQKTSEVCRNGRC